MDSEEPPTSSHVLLEPFHDPSLAVSCPGHTADYIDCLLIAIFLVEVFLTWVRLLQFSIVVPMTIRSLHYSTVSA